MTTLRPAQRAAVTAIAVSVAATVNIASLGSGGKILDFDEIEFEGETTSVPADHYLDQGVVFDVDPMVINVERQPASQLAMFLGAGGSPSNAMKLGGSMAPAIEFTFVMPGTDQPAVTEWVGAMILDREQRRVPGIMQAFDKDGNLLAEIDTLTENALVDTLSMPIEGIHRVRIVGAPAGSFIDNISFGELKFATEDGDGGEMLETIRVDGDLFGGGGGGGGGVRGGGPSALPRIGGGGGFGGGGGGGGGGRGGSSLGRELGDDGAGGDTGGGSPGGNGNGTPGGNGGGTPGGNGGGTPGGDGGGTPGGNGGTPGGGGERPGGDIPAPGVLGLFAVGGLFGRRRRRDA